MIKHGFAPEMHANSCNLHQVFPDVHLCQEFIYLAYFHINSQEMYLLIKSLKTLWELNVETETF